MSEDYRKGYREGFKDGFEEGKKSVPTVIGNLPPVLGNPPNKCHVCGKPWADLSHYVCPRADCPSKITCTIKYDPRTCVSIPTSNARSWIAVNNMDAEQQSPINADDHRLV
jgi:hypothetical protein